MNKKRLFVVASIAAFIGCFVTVFMLRLYEQIFVINEVDEIIGEMRENNALLRIYFQDGDGYMILNNNDEAYLEKGSDSGVTSERVFLKNGNTVQLVDGMTTDKCLSPVDIIGAISQYKNSTKYVKLRGNKVTGSKNDKRKDAFMLTLSGTDNCIDVLNSCMSNAAQVLIAYGANEDSDVKLVVSGYKGVSSYDDDSKTTRSIKNDDILGYGTLQLDLVVDGRAYVIYAMATMATSEESMRLGSKVYECAVGKEMSTEQSYDIVLDIRESMEGSLSWLEVIEPEEETEETEETE